MHKQQTCSYLLCCLCLDSIYTGLIDQLGLLNLHKQKTCSYLVCCLCLDSIYTGLIDQLEFLNSRKCLAFLEPGQYICYRCLHS
jgi:hypothetical protein